MNLIIQIQFWNHVSPDYSLMHVLWDMPLNHVSAYTTSLCKSLRMCKCVKLHYIYSILDCSYGDHNFIILPGVVSKYIFLNDLCKLLQRNWSKIIWLICSAHLPHYIYIMCRTILNLRLVNVCDEKQIWTHYAQYSNTIISARNFFLAGFSSWTL